MANLNKTECNCEGIYNVDTESCEAPAQGVDPCPSVWSAIAGWDWDAISSAGLEWGYGLGILKRPDSGLETAVYMLELEKQKRQSQMIIFGLILFAVVIVVALVLKRKKGKK
jgi:hypothetical protein